MRNPAEPTLKLVLDLLRQDIFANLNCHLIGKIESFNASQQTANISINSKRNTLEDAENNLVAYPLLVDCPVIVLGGGNGSLRLPIAAGDGCLVLFNDRDIDNWFSGSENAILNTDRKHSFSDSIAIVGLRSLAKSISDYEAEKTELVHDVAKVSLSDTGAVFQYDETKLTLASKAKLENSAASLYTILDGVLGVLAALTTTPAVLGVPCSISPAQAAQITAFQTQLGQLME